MNITPSLPILEVWVASARGIASLSGRALPQTILVAPAASDRRVEPSAGA